jgi:hypothetical protein
MTLDLFQALVLRDDALQARLAAIADSEAFSVQLLSEAAAKGIALTEGGIANALQRDPIGLSRAVPVAPSDRWPAREWLPVAIVSTASGPAVDWAHFGGVPLTDPFFGSSVARALARPFNCLFRWQTPIADFVRAAEPRSRPDGFVYHWSRCGSTLVSQMLSALPGSVCISEAQPLDGAIHYGDPDLVRAMIAALGRRSEGPLFLKLNGWHTMALRGIRRLFAQTPWIFLYRDPVEILASHAAMPATEMIPDPVWLRIFGLGPETQDRLDHEARVLARIAEAAIAADGDGGLFVNYAKLPEAVPEVILPHFGIACGPHERKAMAAVARRDAKRPGQAFVSDSEAKQGSAGPRIGEASDRHLRSLYRALEALSASHSPAQQGLVL